MNPQADVTPTVDMSEAFRWETTPTIGVAALAAGCRRIAGEDLHGMRVALISGLRMDDVAGSLTYYFNASQKCARITFTGTTGDPSRIVQLLASRYDFRPVGSEDPGVVRYEIRWNGEAHSWIVVAAGGHCAIEFTLRTLSGASGD